MSNTILSLSQLVWIGMGGAIGAILRYLVSTGVHQLTTRDFPYGTLVVNVLGSLLIGLFAVLLLEKTAQATHWRAFIIIGGLGAFTTFSTFSYETIALLSHGAILRAGLNIVSQVMCCLLATWLGLLCGRMALGLSLL